jgi:cytidylate kinase
VKVYLTASAQERARRRASESGAPAATVLADLTERDQRDTQRLHSPLRPASGALTLDTTGMSVEQVVQRIAELARAA